MHTRASAAPGRGEELAAATRAMAAATRTDRGCLACSLAADVEDPDRVLGLGMWADEAAPAEHTGYEHTREFLSLVPELLAGAPVMYRWLVPDA